MELTIKKIENCKLVGLETVESINRKLLSLIIESDQLQKTPYNDTYENEKQFLQTLYDNISIKKNDKKVKYTYPKGRTYGRVYPARSLSLVSVRREVRHRLCLDNYIDIDIANCHPVLLLQQLTFNNIKSPYLEIYVNERESILKNLMESQKIDRDSAKQIFISIMYGKQINIKDKFVLSFKKEIESIIGIIMNANPEIVEECIKIKKLNKKTIHNLNGTFLSIYCQELEKQVLYHMYNYLTINKYVHNNIVLCYDGCMIPKQELPNNFLESIEKYIFLNTNLNVKLTFKAFDSPLNIKIDDKIDETVLIDDIDIEYDEITKQIINNSYSGSDYDLAILFYTFYKDLFVCSQETPRILWYMFENGIWIKLEGNAKMRFIVENKLLDFYNKKKIEFDNKMKNPNATESQINYFDKLIKKIKIIISKIKSHKSFTDVIKQLVIFFKDDHFMEKIDINPDIICFGVDLFDLKNCEWRKTLSNDYCTLKCGITKEELTDTNEEKLKKILLDIFTTEERMNYMINVFSMFLNGNNQAQTFNVWLGMGANGKSLIQDFFMYAFGDYFCDMPSALITQKEGSAEAASPQLCRGRGRRVAFFTEPEEGTKANNSLLKKWSGGERISCRALYGDPFTYFVFFKIIILCNTKFELQDVQDDSIPRRIEYVNFKTKFDYEPKFEFQKLRVDEYKSAEFIKIIKGSFMNLLINNYIKLKETNFKFPQLNEMILDKNDFIDNNDEIKVFLKNEFTKTDDNKDYIQSKEMFGYFINYCKTNNIKANIKEKTFKERVMKEIPYKERFQGLMDGKQKNLRSIFTNIKLNDDDDDNNPFID